MKEALEWSCKGQHDWVKKEENKSHKYMTSELWEEEWKEQEINWRRRNKQNYGK